MIAEERELAQQMVELEEIPSEDIDINEEIFEAEEAMRRQRDREVQTDPEPVDNSRAMVIKKRVRRTKKEVEEARQMGKEDKSKVDRITFDSTEQVGTPEVETKGE